MGGAVTTGYARALELGADIVVKIDGDGQMDPADLADLVAPLRAGRADYAKGNRFYELGYLESMPAQRVLGNAALSFLTKLSTGYWSIFDPTNGYTAIHVAALRRLRLQRLEPRYFFESDMLFRLGLMRAVVLEVPLRAHYGDETSHLNAWRVLPGFAAKHLRNTLKRLVYGYLLRDFHVASLEWLIGPLLLAFGLVYGGWNWIAHTDAGTAAPTGTVVLAALSTIVGLQLLLSALQFDINNQPRVPLQVLER